MNEILPADLKAEPISCLRHGTPMTRDADLNQLRLEMFDSPEEAPMYTEPEYLYANLATARVIGRGTVGGNPTVDFIFEDEKGQKYVAMLTGVLVENLAAAIIAMRARTKG